MKKLILAFLAVFFSLPMMAQEKLKIKIEIKNRKSDTVYIASRTYRKMIPVNAKGIFEQELEITNGLHQFFDGAQDYTLMYLENGFDLVMTTDANEFDEKLTYTGKGSAENKVLADKGNSDGGLMTYFENPDKDAFTKFFEQKKKNDLALLERPGLAESFKTMVSQMFQQEHQMIQMQYDSNQEMLKLKGKPAPTFSYENYKGGKSSMADFKGKYVYIDIWATWCAPCRAEIPHLKKLEHEMEGKNIVFLSVSIDAKKDYEKWKKMIVDQQLGGVQLFAEGDWNASIVKDYGIQGIPRFILVGPDGNIVDPNAPRPSSPQLKPMLLQMM
ncbi:MAG: TlpA family protein disulfide reductase [Flavobacteriales bacterium]|nr:TlpA family protein disulfide reductase [Flavobacteriales bacterium]